MSEHPELPSRMSHTEAICRILCHRYGMEAIDSMDGSPNWWVLSSDVEKMLTELDKRMRPEDK